MHVRPVSLVVGWCWVLGAAFSLLLPLPIAWSQAPEAKSADVKANEPKAAANKENGRQKDEEFYELMTLFAETFDQVERNYVQNLSRRELMEAAIQGMVRKLDQHSNYIAPNEIDQFRTGVESEFGGIGIQITTQDDSILVVSPLYATPAFRAGVLAGDRITEIDGKTTKGLHSDEAVRRLKGPPGTSVVLTVLRSGKPSPQTLTFELKREVVRVETVLGDRRDATGAWNYFHDDEKKLAYIRLTGFGRHTADDLRDVLKKLIDANMRGLVLDVRFNPGGLLTSAIEISDLFITSGTIVSTEGRNVPKRSWKAKRPGTFSGFPMAILVNGYSASASEIVAACLQDHDRAVVIGERTWGKGSVQNIIELEEGKSALKLTTAGYHRPSGKNIHRTETARESDEWGVKPSDGFEVKLTNEELSRFVFQRRERDVLKVGGSDEPNRTLTDRQLEKAIAYLESKIEKSDPNKSDPDKSDPEKSGPKRTDPTKADPEVPSDNSDPKKSEPAKSEPAKSEPAKSEPKKSDK